MTKNTEFEIQLKKLLYIVDDSLVDVGYNYVDNYLVSVALKYGLNTVLVNVGWDSPAAVVKDVIGKIV